MPAATTLTLDGLADYLRRTGRALAAVDLGPYWRVARVLLRQDVSSHFSSSSGPGGVPWAPLKRPSKRRGGASAKPLIDTALLMSSFVSSPEVQETQTSLSWGNSLFYAGFHQHGTAKIPARPFLGFDDKLSGKLTLAFEDYLKRLLAGL